MSAHGSKCPCTDCRRRRNAAARRRFREANPDAERRGRQDEPAPHGTRARYVRGKCRCEECRVANREYARERYAQRETVHRNLSRRTDLEALEQSLHTRGAVLEAQGGPEAPLRVDEIQRLRAQIARITRARTTARRHP